MKKQSVSLAIILLMAMCTTALAENWVQSGGFSIDLDKTEPSQSAEALMGSMSRDEALENPGFETGVLSPWYSSVWEVTTETPHSGTYCATGEGNNWIRQDFDEIPVEEIISITLWSRQPEEAIQAVDLYYTDGTYYEDIIWPSASWGIFDVTSWLTPGKILNGIRIWGYSGGGPDPDITYIDDISIMTEGQLALKVTPKEVSAWFGGTFTFELFGDGLGGRDYVLLGSATGITPPMVLPGGNLLLLAKDWFTTMLLNAALAGGWGLVNDFIGTLDVNGEAEATLIFPGHCQVYEDIDLWFAWTTYNPFDFQSNTVEATITGIPPAIEAYYYDDGSSENALGWTAGGTACWIHSFDSGVGNDIDRVCSTFGQAGSTSGPSNGTAIDVWVWSDPNQDGEPSDGLVLGAGSGVVDNTNTNDFNHYDLDAVTAVTGKFFVGCSLVQAAGVYAAPMDQHTLFLDVSFFTGSYIGSVYGYWDPYNLGGHPVYAMGAIGYDSVWLLRADAP